MYISILLKQIYKYRSFNWKSLIICDYAKYANQQLKNKWSCNDVVQNDFEINNNITITTRTDIII